MRRFRGVAFALVAVATLIASISVAAMPASAVSSSLGAVTYSQPGKVRLITGELTTVSGTASSDMVGKSVALQLKVSGQWTTVTQTNIRANRTYSMSMRIGGPGAVTYRAVALSSTRWLQVERTITTWKWYSLVDQTIVDYRTRDSRLRPSSGVNVGGRVFGTQLAWMSNGATTGYTDFNLGYKCSVFSTAIGLDDSSPSGSSAIFDVAVDGSPVGGVRRSISLGRPDTLTVEVTGGFRLRLVNEQAGLPRYSIAAWPNAKVLCSGRP